MKLKTRLILSFCIIIFVPLLLMGVVIFAYTRIQARNDSSYSIEGSYAYVANSIRLLNQYANREFREVVTWVQEDPDRALNVKELKTFNEKVRRNGASYIVARRAGTIVFDGAEEGDGIPEVDLPAYGDNSMRTNVIFYVSSRQPALLRQIDFTDRSDIPCTVFMVTTSRSVLPETRDMILNILTSVLLILILTAVILVSWMYQGIVPRLKKLVKAADSIREGNLDKAVVPVAGKDEIAELFRSFEDMRQRLQANQKEKMNNEEEQKQLISNIAHDLKTPITAVKGYAEGLLDGVASTPEKQKQYLKTILNKSNEMNSLINELTLYTRIDTNRIPYNFQHLRAKDFFLDCSEEIGVELAAQRVEFSFYNYTDDGVKITADPEQLARVIHNIISNSIKYRDPDRPLIINLRVKDVGDCIQVESEDNGRGIAPDDLPHIFERTYRADASRNSTIGGSGIGLSIAKKIIEDHGGSIWATSKEGVGTVMYFVLKKYEGDQDGKKDTDH